VDALIPVEIKQLNNYYMVKWVKLNPNSYFTPRWVLISDEIIQLFYTKMGFDFRRNHTAILHQYGDLISGEIKQLFYTDGEFDFRRNQTANFIFYK